jgi:hypothetical protein
MPLVRVQTHAESGVELLHLIEHLPYHLANAVEIIWGRYVEPDSADFPHGTVQQKLAYAVLREAQEHVEAEARRREFFELDDDPRPKTDVVWRSLARQVIVAEGFNTVLAEFLECLLRGELTEAGALLEREILNPTATDREEGETTQ